MIQMEKLVAFAKSRGFVVPGSEIYGGLANSWDYGPLGVELKNNIKQLWWNRFVRGRIDVVGIDSAIIMNPKVWEASGHLTTFNDPLIECKKCHTRFRADRIAANDKCPECQVKGEFTEAAQFNLMFKTFIGPKEDKANVVYLRPETAQGMFVDFESVQSTTRKSIPFGIAQIGKAFRNEITPGNFIFRTREFEQMEIEYFVPPKDWKQHFEDWIKEIHAWIETCGIDSSKVYNKEIEDDELAHYSKRTVDIEFDFPFGRGELYGLAYRGDYDLKQHAEKSGQDLSQIDSATKKQFIPHVIEPTWGVDRTLLAILLSAYTEEEVKGKTRIVLKLKPYLAPYQAAVLPISRKPELEQVANSITQALLAHHINTDLDLTQSIGKRYRRQDEIGTPYCITVDFESLTDQAVTVRDRDTMKQERIAIENVAAHIQEKIKTASA